MSLGLTELKKKYNTTLAREKKAETYIAAASEAEFIKWCPAFNSIVVELSKMIKEYKSTTGKEMSATEVMKGFEI